MQSENTSTEEILVIIDFCRLTIHFFYQSTSTDFIYISKLKSIIQLHFLTKEKKNYSFHL